MRVLIVDGSTIVRRALINCLQGMKVNENEVVQASTGEQAFTHLNGDGKFDLIITDLALTTELTGLELLKRIKRDPRLNATPVIVVSGNSESTTIIETLRSGASSYILRPFNPDVLQNKIRKALNPGGTDVLPGGAARSSGTMGATGAAGTATGSGGAAGTSGSTRSA